MRLAMFDWYGKADAGRRARGGVNGRIDADYFVCLIMQHYVSPFALRPIKSYPIGVLLAFAPDPVTFTRITPD